MDCFNFDRPDWTLLESAVVAAGLAPAACGEFMWMGEWVPGTHSYKHCDTRQYVRLSQQSTDGAQQVHAARKPR